MDQFPLKIAKLNVKKLETSNSDCSTV